MTSSIRPRIAVLGSINRDIVIDCEKLPLPGETVLAKRSREHCGGKGANQAVAACLAGGDVALIGAVGDDPAGNRLIDNLMQRGVRCESIARHKGNASGMAVIAVDSKGQNSILVVPGANSLVTPAGVGAAESVIRDSECLMLQLEVPIESVGEAIRIARQHGVRIILDPAPAPTDFSDALLEVDLICPNETEAATLTGLPVTSFEEAEVAAACLHQRGADNVAITMGEKGTLLYTKQRVVSVPAIPVDTVDTTAAGDAFAGALAVHWCRTGSLIEALSYATAAGALAASTKGAQDSIASDKQIQNLLQNHA